MVKKSGPARPKHVPMRTCIVCRQPLAKRELVRVVRTPEGAVLVDPTGKKAGRGAYLCRRQTCWEQALKRSSLEHALKTAISETDKLGLQHFAAGLADPAKPVEEGDTPA